MKAPIVKIGNSRGIRIPKPVFEQCGFTDEVELEIEEDRLVVRPSHQARKNWEAAFESMAQRKEDGVLTDFEGLSNDWDESNWQWK